MFKFNFHLEEEDNQHPALDSQNFGPNAQAGPSQPRKVEPCYDVSLEDLLDRLPEKFSYSPIIIPNGESILRRDLYDARFQLASEHDSVAGDSTEDVEDKTVNGGSTQSDNSPADRDEIIDGDSDLIPGLYEGGLKTWEGGVDLVELLSGASGVEEWAIGARVLEVGCGTALPSAYLLRQLLAGPATSNTNLTTFHLQDYNLSVLSLVTLPNLLLAALPHLPAESLRPPEEVDDVEDVLPDLEAAGDCHITPELKTAFKTLLSDRDISLQFTYGAWSGFAERLEKETERYDLVLTAETIYSEDSVDDLIDVLRRSSQSKPRHENRPEKSVQLEDSLSELRVHDSWDSIALKDQKEAVILVGAKVLYFGVGGGLQAFLHRIDALGGWQETIKEWTRGVGRRVVRTGW